MKLSNKSMILRWVSATMLAALCAGCSTQSTEAERPGWSLAPSESAGVSPNGQPYGDWNGPGAPKPLMYDDQG